MYWGFGCISTASAKQGFRSDAATAFATTVLGTKRMPGQADDVCSWG
jgi:hypothetical protein